MFFCRETDKRSIKVHQDTDKRSIMKLLVFFLALSCCNKVAPQGKKLQAKFILTRAIYREFLIQKLIL